MNRKILDIFFVMMLIVTALPVIGNQLFPVNNIIYVPNNFGTIQDAIDNAEDGDTVHVNAGIYKEHIVIDKPITLEGDGKHNTIIDGEWTGDVVYISSNEVVMHGFNVTKSGNLQVADSGIEIYGSENCCIYDNYFVNNWRGIALSGGSCNNNISENQMFLNFEGVSIHRSDRNNITGNDLYRNYWGVHLEWSESFYNNVSSNDIVNNDDFGIYCENGADSNNFTYNDISNNVGIGVYFSFSSDNEVIGNNITGTKQYPWNQSGDGIVLEHSNDNLIKDNNIIDNVEYGISIESSSNNLIYNNWFKNPINARMASGTNTWYVAKQLKTNIVGGPYISGNYWSDYTGEDTDIPNDYIGDTIKPFNDDHGPLILPLKIRTFSIYMIPFPDPFDEIIPGLLPNLGVGFQNDGDMVIKDLEYDVKVTMGSSIVAHVIGTIDDIEAGVEEIPEQIRGGFFVGSGVIDISVRSLFREGPAITKTKNCIIFLWSIHLIP